MEQVALSRAVLIRDGTFFLGAEILLIFFLSDTALKWWMGFILMLVYVICFIRPSVLLAASLS